MGTGMRRPWSLRELAADLAAGRVTPSSALARARARFEQTEGSLQAWVAWSPGDRVAGALGGVPLGVKDIIDVAGLPTRCGSPLRSAAGPAADDAAVVTAWRAAGAVPAGKTVTTEFAYFAPGPTRNPAAPTHTPGGSSSGSAAAVAAGHVPLALGTQTAGSVTRPASFCGVASLVVTHGRLPMDGVVGLSPSLDSHGFYAAGVADVALAWSALTGEPDAVLAAVPPPRLLVWTAPGFDVAPPMHAALRGAVERLRASGATVTEFPAAREVAAAAAAQKVVMAYEAARERAAELATGGISPQLAELLHTGESTSDGAYEAAREVVATAAARVGDLLAGHDAVLGPAALGPAPAGLASTGDPALSRAWQAFGLPAVAVPGHTDDAGLPLGLQVIGRPNEETALLAVGCQVERAGSDGDAV